MKKVTLLVVLALLWPVASLAQAHKTTINWQKSTTLGVNAYAVERAPCAGTVDATSGACSVIPTTFTRIATLGDVALYDDTNVKAGDKWTYRIIAKCPTLGCAAGISGESDPSNLWSGQTPDDRPNAASGLTGSAQ